MRPRISIGSINISPGRMVLEVRLEPPPRKQGLCEPMPSDVSFYTDALVAEAALEAFPDLALHACRNVEGPHFGNVLDHTSLPHLLEHMAISAQVSDARTEDGATFVGNTRWLDESAGIAQVSVSFADDMVALEALNRAVSALNAILAAL